MAGEGLHQSESPHRKAGGLPTLFTALASLGVVVFGTNIFLNLLVEKAQENEAALQHVIAEQEKRLKHYDSSFDEIHPFAVSNHAISNPEPKQDLQELVKASFDDRKHVEPVDKDYIDSLFNNIVFVGNAPSDQRDTIQSVGNGFFVGNAGHIITCYHVVDRHAVDKGRLASWSDSIYIIDAQNNTYQADILVASKRHDLVLLKTRTRPKIATRHISFRNASSLQKGEELYCMGRVVRGEINFKALVGGRSQVNSERFTTTGRYIGMGEDPIIYSNASMLDNHLLTEAFARSGYSGSPVSDRAGNIVGLISGSGPKNSKLAMGHQAILMMLHYTEAVRNP